MSCPDCGKTLSTKTINTVGAGKIEVDYCPSCGGIFFDQGEVNRITTEDAKGLSHVVPDHNHTVQPLPKDPICPRCGASLKRFFGESVPDDVHVLRCPDCSGTWFEPDELPKFKNAQSAKLHYFRTWKIPLSSLSAVLIPIGIIVILTGITLITVEQVQKTTYIDLRAREILSNPIVIPGDDRTSAVIVLTTTEPARTTLLLQSDDLYLQTRLPISTELTTTHQIRIQNLTPGTMYRYKIEAITAEHELVSDEYVFSL